MSAEMMQASSTLLETFQNGMNFILKSNNNTTILNLINYVNKLSDAKVQVVKCTDSLNRGFEFEFYLSRTKDRMRVRKPAGNDLKKSTCLQET